MGSDDVPQGDVAFNGPERYDCSITCYLIANGISFSYLERIHTYIYMKFLISPFGEEERQNFVIFKGVTNFRY